MVIGNLLQLDPESGVVEFLIKKLLQTKIGKSLSTAITNSIVFLFVIMMFESQYGSISTFMTEIPNIIQLFAPIVLIIIGMKLMIKSVTK